MLLTALGMPERSARAQRAPGRRVALLVGNAHYRAGGLRPLNNPPNDLEAMLPLLQRLDFEVVTARDTTKAQLERQVGEFGRRAQGAHVGLVFFSGHGFQASDGNLRPVNHLVPVDFTVQGFNPVARSNTVLLDDVLFALRPNVRTGLVFLDACRTDPRLRREGAGSADRGVVLTRGLSDDVVFDGRAGRGASSRSTAGGAEMLVAFATQPRSDADDGPANSPSPFTRSLSSHLGKPGLTMAEVMSEVEEDVKAASGGKQVPWYLPSGKAAQLALVPRPAASVAPPAPAEQPAPPRRRAPPMVPP